MDTVSINKLMLMQVSNSVGTYAFRELKYNKAFRNLDILKSFCKFTKTLNEYNDFADGDDNVVITIDENIKEYLPMLISKYIFDEISTYEEPDFDWVCEMMNIYDQLADDDDTVQDIGVAPNNVDTSDQLDPAQEIKNTREEVIKEGKNQDLINELNSFNKSMDESESNLEEQEILKDNKELERTRKEEIKEEMSEISKDTEQDINENMEASNDNETQDMPSPFEPEYSSDPVWEDEEEEMELY